MYRYVLKEDPGDFSDYRKATGPKKLPVVLTREEIRRLFTNLSDEYLLCAGLMYGSGLRVMETVRLRYSDIEIDRLTVRVRDGKGRKSRFTTLAPDLISRINKQLKRVELFHQHDLLTDWDGTFMPDALARKYRSFLNNRFSAQ